eukprot:m.121234 g.121234  ORF g.121234 m.121234 type:complete len:70 (+) comp13379_c0_seq1:33-242(+)
MYPQINFWPPLDLQCCIMDGVVEEVILNHLGKNRVYFLFATLQKVAISFRSSVKSPLITGGDLWDRSSM